MSIFVDENDQRRRPGPQPDQPGPVPRPAQPRLRHQGGGRHQPEAGRRGVEGIPVFDTVKRPWRPPGPPPRSSPCRRRFAAAAILEAAAAGIAFVVCITEGIPAQDEALTYNRLKRSSPAPGCSARTVPGIISPGKCNIGITSGDIALAGRPGRHRQPLRHPHLPGAARALPAGRRPDDVRRHRRRPGARHQLHRLPGRLRGRPRHPGRHDDRRDRRLRGGAGGRVHRRPDDQAGRGLRRRRDRARRDARWATPAPSSRAPRAPPRPRWTRWPPPASPSPRTRPRPAIKMVEIVKELG